MIWNESRDEDVLVIVYVHRVVSGIQVLVHAPAVCRELGSDWITGVTGRGADGV
jgi:hypothetical protein